MQNFAHMDTFFNTKAVTKIYSIIINNLVMDKVLIIHDYWLRTPCPQKENYLVTVCVEPEKSGTYE